MFKLENCKNIIMDELYYTIGLVLISVCAFGIGLLFGWVYTLIA